MASLDDTFNPATLARSDTATSTTTTKLVPSSAAKTTKQTSYPRVDFEPLYAELKSHITLDNWGTYYEALTRYIRGELNANEFADLCDHFLLINPATEHAHNTLICAILLNVTRDIPEPGTAAWVSAASDKSGGAASSKPTVASDANEQRLKFEIMALPPRERRRIKADLSERGLFGAASTDEESPVSQRALMERYHNAWRIRAPQAATSAAGTKTNWDIEIRKRYTQPLYSETREFPDPNTVLARIVPICYEESIPSGTTAEVAELSTFAAENFLKNFLHEIFTKVRVNGPRYENGAGTGVLTANYLRRLHREETEVKAGRLQRDRDNDLLPIESREAQARRPLGVGDLKLANKVGPSLWNRMRDAGARVNHNPFDMDLDEVYAIQGPGVVSVDTLMTDVDDSHYDWEGTSGADRNSLQSALGDLLAAG